MASSPDDDPPPETQLVKYARSPSPLMRSLSIPGAWVDTPPTFNRPLPPAAPTPRRSSLAPSEPSKPAWDPKKAENDEFYCDLVKGFSDMVLSVYRQECIPKPDPEEGRPGMFLLKKGPSKAYLDTKSADAVEKRDRLAEEAAKARPFKYDMHDLERPTAVLNVDFCVSACSDYVAPPPKERRIAKAVSLLRQPRQSARELKKLHIGQPKAPSPPREPSPEPVDFERPSQEKIHERHQCFDVERIAREFMWWFLEWRCSIRRHIDPVIEASLEKIVSNYTNRLFPLSREQANVEDQYKQALNNLIWELKHPYASRPGQINPNGTPLQNPWLLGDELIHTVLGLTKAHASTIVLRLTTMMRYAKTMRLEKKPYTPRSSSKLWGMLSREAAPYDDGTVQDDMMRFTKGKRLLNHDAKHYLKERKRRLRGDGSAEVHDPDAEQEEENKDNGLSIDDREQLLHERNQLSVERDELVEELNDMKKTIEDLNKLSARRRQSFREALTAAEKREAKLVAEIRMRDWVSGQTASDPDSGFAEEEPEPMDVDD